MTKAVEVMVIVLRQLPVVEAACDLAAWMRGDDTFVIK